MPTPSQSPTLTAAQFNAVDINKDGKVDYSEANRLYQGQGLTQAQLLAMDLNKDGVITLKEQQAWMAQQAAAGTPMPQYRTEYVPQQKTVQRTVMEKVQVPKMVQKQRVIPKFEWDRRVICVPREVTEPVTKMVPRTVQVLVPETTMETKTIYEQKFISIPRQAMIKKPMVKMVKKEIEVPEEYFEEEPAQEMQYYDEQTYETIEVPQTYNETYTEMVAVVREAVPVPVKKKVMQKRPVQKMRKSLQAVEVGTTSQVVGQQFVGQEAVNQQMLASGAYGNYTTSPAAYASGVATSSPSSSSNLFATNDGSTAGGITYNADGSISYK